MNIKKVYEVLEKEENGKELIATVKDQLSEITTLAGKKGEYKGQVKELTEQLEKVKPVLDLIKKEGLTDKSLSDMIETSRKDETDTDILRRELRETNEKLDGVTTQLTEKTKSEEDLLKETTNTTIKDAFSTSMENIKPSILKEHLELGVIKGSLYLDDNGKPMGKIGEKTFTPSEYAVEFTAQRPDAVGGKIGPGSDLSKAPGQQPDNKNLLDKSPAELLAMRYEKK